MATSSQAARTERLRPTEELPPAASPAIASISNPVRPVMVAAVVAQQLLAPDAEEIPLSVFGVGASQTTAVSGLAAAALALVFEEEALANEAAEDDLLAPRRRGREPLAGK